MGAARLMARAVATGPELSLRRLNRTTLLRQSLLERSAWGAAEAVQRLAGLQAQNANSPYVALWSRIRDFAIADLESALEEGSVVKATLMRSTLHLVAASEYPAFDVVPAEARIRNWTPTATRAGVDIGSLHERLLRFASEPRTVAEMEASIGGAADGRKIADHAPSGVRSVAYRVASAPGWLVHVPPSGSWGSFAKPRYVDASVWLPEAVRCDPAEALRVATERYLAAYGPASAEDIGKWVGQPRIGRVRETLEALGDRVRLFRDEDGRQLVDLHDAPLATGDEAAPARFLARWDSAIIGYDRRERIMPPNLAELAIRLKNGDFLPTFTVDGFVAGIWMVETTRHEAILTLTPGGPVPSSVRTELTDEAERLVRFVAADVSRHEVRWAAP
jgi:hypothetical protein